MQVTAFKDHVTGLLFEDEAKLTQFQTSRKRQETAERLRRAERAVADHSRETLCRELASLEQLPELAAKMYEHVLNTAKRKRKKTPLQVCAVRMSSWSVDSRLKLRVDLEIELSGDPGTTYDGIFVCTTPPDVLHPFSLAGCGSAKSHGKTFTYSYGLSADLKRLPKLLATMREAAVLLVAEEAHEQDVQAAVADLQAHDLPLAELDQVVESARIAAEAAQAVYVEALGQRHKLAQELSTAVAKSMPFKQASKLQALTAATGLPMFGQTDRWLALGVRNALLAEAPVDA